MKRWKIKVANFLRRLAATLKLMLTKAVAFATVCSAFFGFYEAFLKKSPPPQTTIVNNTLYNIKQKDTPTDTISAKTTRPKSHSIVSSHSKIAAATIQNKMKVQKTRGENPVKVKVPFVQTAPSDKSLKSLRGSVTLLEARTNEPLNALAGTVKPLEPGTYRVPIHIHSKYTFYAKKVFYSNGDYDYKECSPNDPGAYEVSPSYKSDIKSELAEMKFLDLPLEERIRRSNQ